MDQIGLQTLISLVSNFGIPGIVFILWYLTTRAHERTMQAYKDDMQRERQENKEQMQKAFQRSRENMQEIRQMYESNVLLVKNYRDLAGDLKDVLILNTQAMTTLCDNMKNNQFCPVVRKETNFGG